MLHTFYSSCRWHRNCITTPKTSKIYFLLVLFFQYASFSSEKGISTYTYFSSEKVYAINTHALFVKRAYLFTLLFFTLLCLKMLTFFLFLFTFLLFLCTLCIHFFIILIIFLKQHTTLFTEQHTTKVLSPRLTHLFTKQIRNRYDNMIFLSYP